jgi:anti-anti-sigma regulatory factor
MSTVPLGDDLGIETSAELKERLAPFLSQQDVVLDGGSVRRVHTAALQVLCAFFRSRADAGHQTSLEGCSDVLRDAARLLGLSASLGLAGPGRPNHPQHSTVENAA